MSTNRPGPSATPFRVTIWAGGEKREFPMYTDAAYDNARAAAVWIDDPPFPAGIVDHLGDREVLAGSIVRVLLALGDRAKGDLFFTDDGGHLWGINGRTIAAVEVHDPESGNVDTGPKIGFARIEGSVTST